MNSWHGTTGARAATILSSVFDDSEAAIVVLDGPDLVVSYANHCHTALYGWQAGATPRQESSVTRPGLRSAAAGMLDAATRVLETGVPVRLHEVPAHDRYLRILCSPVRHGDTVTAVTAISIDVSEQVRARRHAEHQHHRLAVLDDATAAVTAELDPRREFAALAHSVVPTLTDACAIYLVDHIPSMPAEHLQATRLVCVIDSELGIPSPAPEVRLRLDAQRPVARAARSGEPVLATGQEANPGQWREHWLATLNPHSFVTVPIGAPGAVSAVVSFAAAGHRPPYQDSDIALMREITERVGVVVGHALRLQRTSEVALALQRGLLSDPPELPGLELRVRYRPAGPGLEVGGDWYDAFTLPDGGIALTVGDVVGHDLYAASTMGQLRSMVQALACQPGAAPDVVVGGLNRLSRHLRVGEMATVVHGRLTPPGPPGIATFHWANAGHPPPLLLAEDGTATVLERTCSPLLGLSELDYPQASVEIAPGGVLLLYTDGLMEDPDRTDVDAIAALAATARRHAGSALDELCDRLIAAAPSRDDIALLAARVKP